MRASPTRIPGIIPPMKRPPMEIPAVTPRMIMGILGGMIMPMDPAVAITLVAISLPYPFCSSLES